MHLFGAAHGRGQKAAPLPLPKTCCTDPSMTILVTVISYLGKTQRNILTTWHISWVPLTSAFFHRKLAIFVILGNINVLASFFVHDLANKILQRNSNSILNLCSAKKVFLKNSQNSEENTCARVSFLKSCRAELYCRADCNFINKETLAQMFSSEFCDIFKNTFFYRTKFMWPKFDNSSILMKLS